jgi:putative DNA primase/helicase
MTLTSKDLATRRDELLAAAIAYAKCGWRITPLWWITADLDGRRACACWRTEKCRTPGKHPLFKGWRESATTDESTIRLWWKHRPRANVGIVTGGAARLVAIDIDGAAGRESLAALEAVHSPLPGTWTQVSGRADGGEHRVFVVPPHLEIDALRNRVKIADGIDIRATGGGLIVAAPSEHITSSRYAVTQKVESAELPEWLYWLIADRYKAARARMAIASAGRPPEHELPSMVERTDRAIGICKAHALAIQGDNGSGTLMSLCAKLVRGLCLPIDVAFEVLIEHYNDTCEPPWSEDELMHKLEDAEVVSVMPWRYVIDEVDELNRNERVTDGDGDMDCDENDSDARAPQPRGGAPNASARPGVDTMDSNCRGAPRWRPPSGFHHATDVDADSDRIMIVPPAAASKPVISYATCEVLRSVTKSGQHHLQLRVLDGRFRGLKKDEPLDWPITSRSTSKWRHLHSALAIEITKPSDTYGKRFRAELLKRSDGVVEVRRSYPPIGGNTGAPSP